MLSRLLAFSLLVSVPVFADDDCEPAVVPPEIIRNLTSVSDRMNIECPNQIHVGNFCAAVENQTDELDPSHPTISFRYQTLIYNASCVQPNDSEATIKAKIQNFWNRYHGTLTCIRQNFNPRDGNILKLAIARQSEPFIEDTLRSWQVSLNHVDSVDNMTVLDYIDLRKREAGSNQSLIRIYQRYYDQFRAAGAKHKRDL